MVTDFKSEHHSDNLEYFAWIVLQTINHHFTAKAWILLILCVGNKRNKYRRFKKKRRKKNFETWKMEMFSCLMWCWMKWFKLKPSNCKNGWRKIDFAHFWTAFHKINIVCIKPLQQLLMKNGNITNWKLLPLAFIFATLFVWLTIDYLEFSKFYICDVMWCI